MTPIPRPTSATVTAIYRAYEEGRSNYESWGLSVGELGNECDRSLFYTHRWVSPNEAPDGRKISIFETGDRWEDRLVADLEAAGVDVTGQQGKIRFVAGHVRGKRDGEALGILEAPKTAHLLEIKSMNDSNFKQVVKHSVRKAQPKHYAQLQLGMHMFGLSRGAYLVVNKNTDERHLERIEYDLPYCARLLARAERIVMAESAPARAGSKPTNPVCMFCKHKPICHPAPEDRPPMPRVHCRTCAFAQPTLDGDAAWMCTRDVRPLSIDQQREGCPAHLFSPSVVPGEVIDSFEEDGWIKYRLSNGQEWVDGVQGEDVQDA